MFLCGWCLRASLRMYVCVCVCVLAPPYPHPRQLLDPPLGKSRVDTPGPNGLHFNVCILYQRQHTSSWRWRARVQAMVISVQHVHIADSQCLMTLADHTLDIIINVSLTCWWPGFVRPDHLPELGSILDTGLHWCTRCLVRNQLRAAFSKRNTYIGQFVCIAS